MFEYIEKIKGTLTEIEEEEREKIKEVVSLIVNATLEKDSIYIFGASHAGILSEEMYYRAGGMITFNAIFGREVMLDRQPITFTSKMERLAGYGKVLADSVDFKENDILILHSVSGRNPVIIDMALSAKRKGVTIVALTNLKYSKSVKSRHSSGQRLFEIADFVLDNHGDIGDAICKIKGSSTKVGPSSTVIGAAILNTIVTEATKELVTDKKVDPPVFYSANLDGGDKKNKKLISKYRDVIHYRF